MSWIDASWMVMIAACLTLSSIHLVIWNKQRGNWAHFAFSLAGISVAGVGVFELLLMHARSPEHFAVLLRWAHIPFAVLAPCLVAFVRLHLRAGRPWLGHLAWGLRALALIPNFTTGRQPQLHRGACAVAARGLGRGDVHGARGYGRIPG